MREGDFEDKYCSLCGAMVVDDGSCPNCTTPLFINCARMNAAKEAAKSAQEQNGQSRVGHANSAQITKNRK